MAAEEHPASWEWDADDELTFNEAEARTRGLPVTLTTAVPREPSIW